MKIALTLLAAYSLIVPGITTGQAPTRVPITSDSVPIIYAVIKADRAGITADRSQRLLIRLDSAKSDIHIGVHIKNAFVGGLIGTFAGLGIGAGVGALIDSHGTGDATFPATLLLAYWGAIWGLAAGLLVGAIWPVK
ncbi:MAG TPA: hypothetical protein VHE82_10420 [Gemmatimonadaceae bacterium]|nr:hypothetical protein [Gemmatimonadaceae bacterium]